MFFKYVKVFIKKYNIYEMPNVKTTTRSWEISVHREEDLLQLSSHHKWTWLFSIHYYKKSETENNIAEFIINKFVHFNNTSF